MAYRVIRPDTLWKMKDLIQRMLKGRSLMEMRESEELENRIWRLRKARRLILEKLLECSVGHLGRN